MRRKKVNANHQSRILREILSREHLSETRRMRQLRLGQRSDCLPIRGDEMDIARAQADADLQAQLVDRCEGKLSAISSALRRLGSEGAGVCEACGDEITPERLLALPSATLC